MSGIFPKQIDGFQLVGANENTEVYCHKTDSLVKLKICDNCKYNVNKDYYEPQVGCEILGEENLPLQKQNIFMQNTLEGTLVILSKNQSRRSSYKGY